MTEVISNTAAAAVTLPIVVGTEYQHPQYYHHYGPLLGFSIVP